MNTCDQCVVRDTAICRSLDEADVGEMLRLGRRRKLESGQVWAGLIIFRLRSSLMPRPCIALRQ